MRRVLAIGLDGFDIGLGERLMSQGRLPNLQRLRADGASFLLDHGRDKLSGLAWEHVASGLAPSDGGRWSAVRFDADACDVFQDEGRAPSFLPLLDQPVVAFDLPYCHLPRDGKVMGLANWGAHDPGVPTHANPPGLAEEIEARFGPYPAADFIYGFCWPSVAKTEALSAGLVAAVEKRKEIALWLLGERLPDWNLAIIVPSEAHSGAEPLWHGVDPAHPLHAHPSATAARDGLIAIYEALDRLVGSLADAFPDAALLAFSMHGMGANEADVPAMALLPELLYRRAFGKPWMRAFIPEERLPDGTPLLREDETWEQLLRRLVPSPDAPRGFRRTLAKMGLGPRGGMEALRRLHAPGRIGWMPATRYRPFWPRMDAFALPAFYDGQIRINLEGREAQGRVPASHYEALLAELEALLSECRNPLTGGAAIRETYRPAKAAQEIGPYEADLYVLFEPNLVGLQHPGLGTVGPLPWRRTGGHSGDWGFLFGAGPGVPRGANGTASSFDVVPTLIAMLGGDPNLVRSGSPLFNPA
ncbi:hypothetical protein [Parvibaculum sp.]|uniref:hypothetical protein n=1 Tax=Parvibaculum sp. TaxID=2024848 RepID=UPI00320CF77A